MNLYPLKFKPVIKEKIWGGDLLNPYLPVSLQGSQIGEIWTLSGYDESETVVANGYLADNTINELVEVYMGELVGDRIYEHFGNQFPILIKLIGAGDKLSVQVHPDDNYAQNKGYDNGKNEFWYVLRSDSGRLIGGVQQGATLDKLKESIENNTLNSLLCEYEVKEGDCMLIESGMVHALGSGVCVVEIQQTSDLTFRIYDYDRTDAQGNKRPLHIKEALSVINTGAKADIKNCNTDEIPLVSNLCKHHYFTINQLTVDKPIGRDYATLDSFVIFVCIEGQVELQTENGNADVKCGETVLVPCSLNDVVLIPKNEKSKVLEVYIDSQINGRN